MPITNEYNYTPRKNPGGRTGHTSNRPQTNGRGRKKKKKNKYIGRKIVLICSIVTLIISGVLLFRYFFGYAAIDRLNDKLAGMYDNLNDLFHGQKNSKGMLKKFEKLYNKNHDLVGWIKIDDTKVSYPVVKSKDNSYYLTHSFDNKKSKSGSIFMDYRTTLTAKSEPDNYVLYGHDMRSGEYFAPLLKYKKIDFFKEHSVITFDTIYNEGQWKIIGCFLTGGSSTQDKGNYFNYCNCQNFKSKTDFEKYYKEVMKRTYFNTGVDVKYGDELLTMSTCSNEYWNSRFVVVARRVRKGESTSIDKAKITVNSDKYMPKEWYDVQHKKCPH